MDGNGLDEGLPRHGASVRVPVVFVGEVHVMRVVLVSGSCRSQCTV